MNDAHNASNYTFAAALFIGTGALMGMTPLAIVIGVLIATVIIFVACCVSGQMGYETGAPYPVISRVTWGIWGANFPAIVRGIVAIAWYGIQTYLASISLELLLMRVFPVVQGWDASFVGLRMSGWLAFLILSIIQLIIVWRGMEAVRHFQGAAGPTIWVIMIGLGLWMLSQADWQFHWTVNADGAAPPLGTQVHQVLVAVGLTVGTLATLMLNFSDFARYAPSSRSMVMGNLLGLPLNWTAFAMTSVLCSAAAIEAYGVAIHDPGELLSLVDNDIVFYVVSLGFIVATIGVNIVANFVSAAFDLSNVNPKRISFRVGGIVAVVASIVVTPWNLYGSPAAITYFLGSLGALLGPFFGILVIDYFYFKRAHRPAGPVLAGARRTVLLPARDQHECAHCLHPGGDHRPVHRARAGAAAADAGPVLLVHRGTARVAVLLDGHARARGRGAAGARARRRRTGRGRGRVDRAGPARGGGPWPAATVRAVGCTCRRRRGPFPGPISSRNRTDLEPEPDRSRAGTGPISVRNSTDLGEGARLTLTRRETSGWRA